MEVLAPCEKQQRESERASKIPLKAEIFWSEKAMTMIVRPRCWHCKARYELPLSGWKSSEGNDRYCPDCWSVIAKSLEAVPAKLQHAWVGTSDATVEELRFLVDTREKPGLMDLTRPSNKNFIGFASKDKKTLRYEFWTEQGGPAAGRVWIEAEKDASTGAILGPWDPNDRWDPWPTFIEHPPWPEAPPPTHHFVRKPFPRAHLDALGNTLKRLGDLDGSS